MAYLGDHDNLLPDGKPRNNQSVVAEGTKAFCNLPPSSNVAVGLAAGEANRATTFSSFQHHICYFLVNVQTLRIKLTFYSPKVIIHLLTTIASTLAHMSQINVKYTTLSKKCR